MNKENKRLTSHLVPYLRKDDGLFFFLQKRSDSAERHPGWLTIFGGGVEDGEPFEKAMLREMKEELSFVPQDYFYLGEYSDDYSISHYYAAEVPDDFEKEIKIGEGDYGKFFSEKEVKNEIKLTENNKLILSDLRKHILETK